MHPVFDHLVQVLQRNPNIHSIYFAHPDGKFYEVINIQNRTALFQTLDAPAATQRTGRNGKSRSIPARWGVRR